MESKRSSKAGNKCCLPHCRRSKRDFPDMKLYKFPDFDTPLFMKWVEKCNLSEKFVEKSPLLFLCENHFTSDLRGKRYLKRGSVPNLWLSEKEPTPVLKRTEDSDIDISLLRSPPRKRQRSESPVSRCKSCHKNIKNVMYYKDKYLSLVKKLELKKRRILILRKENCRLRKLTASLKMKKEKFDTKASIEDEIDQMNINENEKTLCKMLLKSKRGKASQWDAEEKLFSQNLYYRSSSAYIFLRDKMKLNLPSTSSLSRWNPIKNLQPGNNACIFNALKDTTDKLNKNDKECILVFDEVSIRHNLYYNVSTDIIDGLVDYGFERKNKVGGQICVFMLRGLTVNWKFILKYVVSENSVKAEVLQKLILEILDVTEKLGLNIRAITCDQGTNNRKCYKLFNATVENPYFMHNSKTIYLLYDVPHLIKSLRNCLLKADFKIPEGTVKFDVIREIFEIESGKATKMTKLTLSHIEPTSFEKMRVSLATQIFSHSVSAAIRTACTNNQLKRNSVETAISTANFIAQVNTIFDCLNSKVLNDSNPFKCGLKKNNLVWGKLEEMLDFIKEIKYTGNKIFCVDGLAQTINGILQVANDMFQEDEIFFLLTARFNQDPLENAFSYIRAKGGNCRNPSAHEFNNIVAKLMSLKLLQFSNKSNCQEDEDHILSVEFKNEYQNLNDINESVEELRAPSFCLNELIEKNESYFDENVDSFNNDDIPIEITSSRYFVGYIAHRVICDNCKIIMIKPSDILTYPSEVFIHEKNYSTRSDFGSLCAPSDIFFDVCKIHIKVFEEVFNNCKEMRGIGKFIIQKCIDCTKESSYSFWFDENNLCFSHRIKVLEMLITILLRKHCSWLICKGRNAKSAKNERLQHLQHR